MNIKSVIIDNHAHVFSNKGIIIKPLTDNLEEILKQENKIELMEEEIKRNKEKNVKDLEELKKDKKLIFLGFPWIFLSCFFFSWALSIGGNNPFLLGAWNLKEILIGFGIIAGGVIGLGWSLDGFIIYQSDKRKIERQQLQNFFLEKELEKEKSYLKELEDLAIPIVQEEPTNLIDIDNKILKEKLKEYKEKLNYYQKKVKKFYNHPLTEKFKREMEQNGIDAEIFEDYLAEQKRSLKK